MQDYGFRIYNPSLGKFLSVDPLTASYPWYTPYQFAGNIPVRFIDLDGLEPADAQVGASTLVIVIQGNAGDPPDGATQADNYAKTNNGIGGSDADGLGGYARLAQSATTQVVVFAASNTNNTQNDVLTTINNFRSANEGGKVIVVGHSLGADNAIEMFNNHTDVTIDLFIGVDAMDVAGEWDDDNIPSNVKKGRI